LTIKLARYSLLERIENENTPMQPLYAARVSDLKPGDFVRVECICGHDAIMLGKHPCARIAARAG
jgi:hypothetical protein